LNDGVCLFGLWHLVCIGDIVDFAASFSLATGCVGGLRITYIGIVRKEEKDGGKFYDSGRIGPERAAPRSRGTIQVYETFDNPVWARSSSLHNSLYISITGISELTKR
jgi:hypothetical protein